MVSQVQKAKEHCGYEAKPVTQHCSNCGAFASDMWYPGWVKTEDQKADFDRKYAKIEQNRRCTDHGFSIKKKTCCRLWRAKAA